MEANHVIITPGVDFREHFWSEKQFQVGFDALFHNFKESSLAVKELLDFLRERAKVEEIVCNHYSKLVQRVQGYTHGSFLPLWQVIRVSIEKLVATHGQLNQKCVELSKEVSKYGEEMVRKGRLVKEEEGSTQESVAALSKAFSTLSTTREGYVQRCQEVERLRGENCSQRELDKAEGKLRKSREEYRAGVERFNAVRGDFENNMMTSCSRFQMHEEHHLMEMHRFMDAYVHSFEFAANALLDITSEFRAQQSHYNPENLLQIFIESKETGRQRPAPAVFEEFPGERHLGSVSTLSLGESTGPSVSAGGKKDTVRNTVNKRITGSLLNLFNASEKPSAPSAGGGGDGSPGSGTSGGAGCAPQAGSAGATPPGFLRSKRKKKEKKKQSGGPDNAPTPTVEENGTSGFVPAAHEPPSHPPPPPPPNSHQVDEEGYSIRPVASSKDPKMDLEKFYSSSDSEGSDGERRIHVEIKPLSKTQASPFSASVDELSASIKEINLKLSAVPPANRGSPVCVGGPPMLRSISLGDGRSDLTTLSPPPPPHSEGASPMGEGTVKRSNQEILDLFKQGVDTPPMLPPKHGRSPETIVPRPQALKNRSITSPSPSTDSVASLTDVQFRSNVSIGSRGPSPLTLGWSETVPIAVAFQEVVHACFRGTDESLCRVKKEGNLVMSFPAGMIRVLTTNSNPAVLMFRIKNVSHLTHIVANSQLIPDPGGESGVYAFSMPSLANLLRTQSEANPKAAYFNVDILKYQIRATPGATAAPFHLVSYWKCELGHTDLRVDYKYNPKAWPSGAPEHSPLLNISVSVPVQGGVTRSHFKPEGQWGEESCRALWRITELSDLSENGGVGSLRARFELSHGPGGPSAIACQFNADGSSLSGADFELVGTGYRVSLLKRRFRSGKYFCEAEGESRYAAPPGAGS